MRRRFIAILLLCMPFAAVQAEGVTDWFEATTNHLETIWDKGGNELYIPLYTYHMPYAYSQEKINQYTEFPLGIGFGKGLMNESGNWEGLYAMTFKDSHGIYQYLVGYGWVPMWNIGDNADWKYGVGVAAFIMSRQDIMNYIPFPGALPVASISYKDFSLQTAYIPGGQNIGNVVFTWAKYNLP